MKFRTKYRHIDYEVIPATYRTDQYGRREIVPGGLVAQFREHFFDSDIAQKRLIWSDDQRKRVEAYLMHHGDFGDSLYFADGQNPPEWFRKEDQPTAHLAPEVIRCVATVFDDLHPQGRLCMKEAVSDNELCAEHQAEAVLAQNAMAEAAGV